MASAVATSKGVPATRRWEALELVMRSEAHCMLHGEVAASVRLGVGVSLVA